MSSTLVWKPVESPKGCLGDQLKRVIGSWKFGGDGSCWDGSVILAEEDVKFLEGLLHARIGEAGDLIDLIHKYEHVELLLEY